jgi:hypothetical protein
MQWEYRTVGVEFLTQEFLNGQGADGFELIQVMGGQLVGIPPNQTPGSLLIFKKPIGKK